MSEIIFLLFTMQLVLRWKYGSTTLGHKTIQTKNYKNFIYSEKLLLKINVRPFFVCCLSSLSLELFHIETIISKCQMSISWSKDRWRSFICIPREGQTHIMTHTKREPRARPLNPFFLQKNHFRNYQKLLSDCIN